MTHRHSNSQPYLTVPPHGLRLVQRKASQPDASQQSEGIRPTRQGPWDPCRFQEYELSPEFRMQVMLTKLPPADPKIFRDTTPPTQATDIDTAPFAPLTAAANTNTTSRESLPSEHHSRRRWLKSAAVVVALAAAAVLAILLIRHAQAPGHGAHVDRGQFPLSANSPETPEACELRASSMLRTYRLRLPNQT